MNQKVMWSQTFKKVGEEELLSQIFKNARVEELLSQIFKKVRVEELLSQIFKNARLVVRKDCGNGGGENVIYDDKHDFLEIPKLFFFWGLV